MKIQRNDPCACNSGKKYKHCCQGRDKQAPQNRLSTLEFQDFVEKPLRVAFACLDEADLEGAKAIADKLISLYPNDPAVNLLQGLCHLSAEDANGAIHFLERSSKLNPNDAPTYLNLGYAYNGAGRVAEAVSSFRTALEVDRGQSDVSSLAKQELEAINQ